MMYTAPCIMFRMRANPLRGEVGGGWALEFSSILGLVKWHRADRRVPFIRNQKHTVRCIKGRSGANKLKCAQLTIPIRHLSIFKRPHPEATNAFWLLARITFYCCGFETEYTQVLDIYLFCWDPMLWICISSMRILMQIQGIDDQIL